MRKDILVAIVTGILAFVGAVGGTYFSSRLEEGRFERQFTVQQYARVLDKRVALIDQCARARAQLLRAKTIMSYADVEAMRLAALKKASGRELELLDKMDTGVHGSHSHALQQEFSAIRTEYFSCVQTGGLLFWPRTKQAALALNTVKPTWYESPDSAELTAFITSMIDELGFHDVVGRKTADSD